MTNNERQQSLDTARNNTEDEMKIKETLRFSQYEIQEEIQSQIDSQETFRKTVDVRCPYCKKPIGRVLQHFDEYRHSCGLLMKLHGNALECEVEK